MQSSNPQAEDYLDPDVFVTFGQHKGERWTRVPISYLRWMWNNNHTHLEQAVREMERRGMPFTKIEMELSGHAIDRASTHNEIRRSWEREGLPCGIGLNRWLTRLAVEAHKTPPTRPGQRVFSGFVFEFFEGECWPVLKTIHPHKRRHSCANCRHWDRPVPRGSSQGYLWGYCNNEDADPSCIETRHDNWCKLHHAWRREVKVKNLVEGELRRMMQQHPILNLIGKDGKEVSGELTESNDGFHLAGAIFTWEDVADIDASRNLIELKPAEGEKTG